MAQNCILGYTNTMDGFGVLKAMLKIVHPILNNKRPSNVPPLFSLHQDIHAYEQSLRNYYQLHKLYNGTEFRPLEKSKQFLHGIDDDQYTSAVTRIRHILDTTEAHGADLNDDYTIDNLASTIINLTTEYEHTTTVVRTMRHNHSHRPVSTPSQTAQDKYTPRRNFQRNRNGKSVRKIQCHACKMFGHAVQKCTLLPKALAIIQFQSKQKQQCELILKQHIANNTVEAKRNIVHVLQSMQILPMDVDPDEYIEDDIIVNHMVDNVFQFEPSTDNHDSDKQHE